MNYCTISNPDKISDPHEIDFPPTSNELCSECGMNIIDGSNEIANDLEICQFCWPKYLKKCDQIFKITLHSVDNHEKFVAIVTDHGNAVYNSGQWYDPKTAIEKSLEYCEENEYVGFER